MNFAGPSRRVSTLNFVYIYTTEDFQSTQQKPMHLTWNLSDQLVFFKKPRLCSQAAGNIKVFQNDEFCFQNDEFCIKQ